MLSLLRFFWEIALFRRAPQDLPVSTGLLKLTAMFYVLVGVAAVLLPLPVGPTLLIAVLEPIVIGVSVVAALSLRGFPQRVVQTLTAIYGVLGLIGLLMLPVTAWVLYADAREQPVLMAAVVFYGLYLWSVAALGHILRHALTVPLWAGVAMAWFYFMLLQMIAPLLMA